MQLILSLDSKLTVMLLDIIMTQWAERALQALVANGTNYAARWICQQVSLSSTVVILMKNAYLEGFVERFILCYFSIGPLSCYDWFEDTQKLLCKISLSYIKCKK
jgi:hypothetical protein